MQWEALQRRHDSHTHAHNTTTLQADAAAMEEAARAAGGPDALVPNAEGTELQKALAAVAADTAAGKFNYNKFFAIGLFRCTGDCV